MPIEVVLLLVVAIAIPAVIFWKFESTPAAAGLVLGVNIGIVVLVGYGGRSLQALDTEILNGEVTGKEKVTVSCSHSYPCNCVRSSNGSTSCSTCYEHSVDYSWRVHSNIGELDIDRVDRQGKKTPSRWAEVRVGEPFAKEHMYLNYIKAVPDSLFNSVQDKLMSEKTIASVPPYPADVHDYYRINRALSDGVAVPELQKWSDDISDMLKQLGPQKQANVVVLFTKAADPLYEYGVRSKWLGGKKNDIVVIFGTPEYPKISWVRILSWTDRELFKVTLRDTLMEQGTVDRAKAISAIRSTTMTLFQRKPMADFKYLWDEVEPPTWATILGLLFMFVAGFVAVRYPQPRFR